MTIVLAILYSDSPPCALLARYGVEWFYFYVPFAWYKFQSITKVVKSEFVDKDTNGDYIDIKR